jgi:hypothetical protein
MAIAIQMQPKLTICAVVINGNEALRAVGGNGVDNAVFRGRRTHQCLPLPLELLTSAGKHTNPQARATMFISFQNLGKRSLMSYLHEQFDAGSTCQPGMSVRGRVASASSVAFNAFSRA